MILKFDEFLKMNESRLDNRVDKTKEDMEYIQECVEEMLNCVKNKEKESSKKLEELMASHRGLLITGKSGIGKTKGIQKAIEKTNAEQHSDYVKIGTQVDKERLEKILSNYKNSVIIFDDTPFKDEDCWNIIKNITNEKEIEREFEYDGKRMKFNGFIIIVTNHPIDELQKQIKNHFGAIARRLSIFDFNLSDKEAWEYIKEVLEDESKNKDIKDEKRLLPLEGEAENSSIENIIKFIDDVMDGKHDTDDKKYGYISFRTIVAIRDYIKQSKKTEDDWKKFILKEMLKEEVRK